MPTRSEAPPRNALHLRLLPLVHEELRLRYASTGLLARPQDRFVNAVFEGGRASGAVRSEAGAPERVGQSASLFAAAVTRAVQSSDPAG